MADNSPVTPDTEINVKVAIGGTNKKVKIPLRDLGPDVFPAKLRALLDIPPSEHVTFERFSDSAGFFVLLDPSNNPVYKQLFRAAKAKLKLRIRATVVKAPVQPSPTTSSEVESADKSLPQPTLPISDLSAYGDLPPQVTGIIRQSSIPRISAGPQVDSAFSSSSKPSVGPSAQQQAPSSSVLIPGLSESSNTPREVTDPVTEYKQLLNEVCRQNRAYIRGLGVPPPPPLQLAESCYNVYCNSCNCPIGDEHYHCSTCDGGDFDLCLDCVASGRVCDGDGHWLIKRNIQSGRIINSTTERLPPRVQSTCKLSDITEAPRAGSRPGSDHPLDEETRTCNSCVDVLPESKFVTCTVCDDFDLCLPCLVSTRHGHHPHHPFEPAVSSVKLEPDVAVLCAAGRNVAHAAICDNCEKSIRGIRHKCLDCPDWDYCSACFASAYFIHPGHRFCPVFGNLSPRRVHKERHSGILCDGPLCTGKHGQKSISGDRYKCTVCHDTDFCANCEASPANQHNRSHPLIKFKTPIRNVTVSTYGETNEGEQMAVMGDLHASIGVTPAPKTETPVQPPSPEKVVVKPSSEASGDLNARFLSDGIPDGTKLGTGQVFTQTWKLQNTGPGVWPAGCSVKFIGGDNMRNIDLTHPISVADLERSVESSVLSGPVEVGKTWTFSVTLKTPSRAGKFISYWRLTAPNGVKFGHKLWCDIDVAVEVRSQSSPPADQQLNPFEVTRKQCLPHTDRTRNPLEDYQLQLMLLEQQNKRRLLNERSRKEASAQHSSHQLEMKTDGNGVTTAAMVPTVPLAKTEDGEKLIDVHESKATDEQSKASAGPALDETVNHKSTVEDKPSSEDVGGEVKSEGPISESAMIFPTLDKESPMTSNDGAKTENVEAEHDDVASELADLTLEDEESEDDFLTDEEYDILDASDEELSSAKGTSK